MSNPQTPLANLGAASRGAVAVVHQTADLLDSLADGQLDAALARLQASKDALHARLARAAGIVQDTALDVLNAFLLFAGEHEGQVKANAASPVGETPLLGVPAPAQPPAVRCGCDDPGCSLCCGTGWKALPFSETGDERPLTDEEAESAWDAAPEVPIDEDRIKEIVEYATSPASPATAEEARDDRRPLPDKPLGGKKRTGGKKR